MKRDVLRGLTLRAPRIRDLDARQVERVLSRNEAGRVAFVDDKRVEIQPVNYAYADGAIYGRTSFGTKYRAWMHRPFVAFEVDEIEGPLDWRSVVIHGTVYVLHSRGSPAEEADHAKALETLRARFPDAFTDQDRTPSRTVIFRIEVHEVTGREARGLAR